jgi:invasion protein IalB
MPPKVIASFGDWNVTCEETPARPAAAAADAAGAAAKPAQKQAAAAPAAPADGAAAPAQKSCGVIQTAKSDKNPNVAVSLIVVKAKGQDGKDGYMMRVMAPIGVFLPLGVALEIDGNAVGRVPYTRCVPQLCMAFAEASPPTLDKLKKGKAANFIIYEAPGAGLPLKFTLKGFGDALAALEKTGTAAAD